MAAPAYATVIVSIDVLRALVFAGGFVTLVMRFEAGPKADGHRKPFESWTTKGSATNAPNDIYSPSVRFAAD
jgi:hypothetical protein